MSSSSSPARQASINLSSSSSAKPPDENPPFNSTHQILGNCQPVPNTYSNGTQVYGTLGRRQQRQQRPLSGNGGTLVMNGRPRSQRLDSDASSSIASIILNPTSAQNNLLESNNFNQNSHFMPPPGHIPFVNYNPNTNEWMQPQYFPMQQTVGSTATSIGAPGSLIEENHLRNGSPFVNQVNAYNTMHLLPKSGGGGSGQIVRGSSMPTPNDRHNYVPDLEDTSSVAGSGIAPMPMIPLSDQHLVRYSTIGRPNRLHNYQYGNTHNSARLVNTKYIDLDLTSFTHRIENVS